MQVKLRDHCLQLPEESLEVVCKVFRDSGLARQVGNGANDGVPALLSICTDGCSDPLLSFTNGFEK